LYIRFAGRTRRHVRGGRVELVQAAQHALPRRDERPLPLGQEQPRGFRSAQRLDPQPAAINHEAKVPDSSLVHIASTASSIGASRFGCRGNPDEEVVDGADGVDPDVGRHALKATFH
jgi:hypothetical protein